MAVIGLFGWKRMAQLDWVVDVFRTFFPFAALLLLAWPQRKPRVLAVGMVLGMLAFLVGFIEIMVFVIDWPHYTAWFLVWPAGLGGFLLSQWFKWPLAKKICVWILAGWCLLWVFYSGINSFWERLQMFGQCALWVAIALKEGRSESMPDAQTAGKSEEE